MRGQSQRPEALASEGIHLEHPINDDLLEAAVGAWTAGRYAQGQALPFPDGH